jgi:hypothetical protein
MTALRSRGVIVLVLILSLAACKKELAETTPHPTGAPPKPVMPPLMAYVPADTPYLVAGLEGIPPDLYARMKRAFEPLAELARTEWQTQRKTSKVVAAILSELDGKWSEAGIESLGFSAQPRFAIYGLDLQPVIVRVAVKDDKLVRATIERVVARAGETLPAMATKDGRNYWLHRNRDGSSFVIALADNQLVFAIGRAPDIDARLGLILGSEKPVRSMADGALVKQLMARHDVSGQLIGFADTRRIAGKAVEAAGGTATPACNSALDQLSSALPRLVFGYRELSATRVSAALVLELSPDAVTALQAIRTEVPGLSDALSEPSLLAIGGGVDLAAAQQIGVAVAGQLEQLGQACALGSLVDGAGRIAHRLSRPLPEPLGQISGGAIVVDDVVATSGPDAKLEKIDGVALIGSPDARSLFDEALKQQPLLGLAGITADGKLHDVAFPLPFAVSAGVGDRLVVVAAGDKRVAAAAKLLGAHGGGKGPLLAVSYDVGKLWALGIRNGSLAPGTFGDPRFGAIVSRLQNLIGRLYASLEITGHGLTYAATMELK